MTSPALRSPLALRLAPALRWVLVGMGCALFLLGSGARSALAAPRRLHLPAGGVAATGPVAFPAAIGIQPTTQPVGPDLIGPVLNGVGTALVPNDAITFLLYYGASANSPTAANGGAILNFSIHGGGNGAESVLASSSVGSGVAWGNNEEDGVDTAVSPAGMIYYFDYPVSGNTSTVASLVMINPVTGVRTVVSAGNNTSLGPAINDAGDFCWDLSTNTILYFNYPPTGTTTLNRVDPATGKRTAITNAGVAYDTPYYLTTDAFGNVFYLDEPANTVGPSEVIEIPVTSPGTGNLGTSRVVSGPNFSGGNGTYYDLGGVAVDPSQAGSISSNGLPVADSLLVGDAGNDQSTSAIYRLSTTSTAPTVIISNARNTASGTAVFDEPVSPFADTTGKIYYLEDHNFANGDTSEDDTLNYLTLSPLKDFIESGAQNLEFSQVGAQRKLVVVPPPQPTLTAGTVTNNATGTSVTLNSNATADGGVANSGVITRGFVYASTTINAAPRLGGTGVTQIVNYQSASLPVAQGANLGAFTGSVTGLTSGTSYTFSAYAQNVSGYAYTAPVAFTVATAPAVTTSAATAITGVSATLGGNVTSDGGGGVTARGIVYSSTNTTPVIGGSGVTNLPDASATTGTFTDGTGNVLANGTLYYFRAYATNGVGTTYGGVLSFTTIAPPTANSQSVTTTFNAAKAITLTGSDPNTPAQTLTYAIVSAPTHGTLSGTAPNLTYTPTANYQGSDSFTFRTTNTTGLTSNLATVSITVTPGTPTANSQSVTVGFNTATSVTLTASDPDSPALTLTYTVQTAPTHGTLSGTAPNLTYTPAANYHGSDSFTFTARNGTNTSNTAMVTLTVVAGTPTATSQSGLVVLLNTPKAITLTGTDPDSPALALTYTVASQPTNGTLSGTAPNLTYTPNIGYTGPDSFTFTANNGQNTSAAATVSLTVVGQPYVTGFTASGAVGSTVTLTGNNFLGMTGVTFFRSVTATTFTVVSDTQMTVVVPTGAKTGVITLTNGLGTNTTPTKFTVTAP